MDTTKQINYDRIRLASSLATGKRFEEAIDAIEMLDRYEYTDDEIAVLEHVAACKRLGLLDNKERKIWNFLHSEYKFDKHL